VGPEAGFYLPFLARGGVSNLTVCGASRQLVNLAVEADAYVTRSEVASTASLRWGGLSAGAYDAILLAPAPAWRRGAQSLYSRRALLGYKRALAADGIVALHLDARALCEERLAAIARDFCSVFPGVQVWCTGAYDWVLIGGASPVKAPLDTLLSLYEREEVFRDFARAGGLSMPDALASMLCDGEGLRAWLNGVGSEGAWASAWRAPSNAIGTGRRVVQPAALERARQWKAGWLLPGQLDLDVYVSFVDKVGRSIGARSKAAAALADMAMGRGESALAQAQEAAKISPRDALLVQLAEIVELEGRRRIKIGDMAGALKCYENLLSFSPGSARAHYGMGYCLRGKGDGENAYLHFVRAVADAPEQAAYRFELAQAAVAIGEYAEADRQFKEGLRREPDNPEALFRYAKCLTIKDRPVKDFKQAASLAERACQLTGWKNSEYAFGLADLYMDAGRVLEGLGLKRRLKEGVKPAAPSAP
jgi:tetratricopeptide (TPR) repeat protein